MGKNLDKFFDWLSVKKYSDQIPCNYIEEELRKKRRIPWVIKRRVLVNGKRRQDNEKIRYIEFKVPEDYDKPFTVPPVNEDRNIDHDKEVKTSIENHQEMNVFYDELSTGESFDTDGFYKSNDLQGNDECLSSETEENEEFQNEPFQENIEANSSDILPDEVKVNRIYQIVEDESCEVDDFDFNEDESDSFDTAGNDKSKSSDIKKEKIENIIDDSSDSERVFQKLSINEDYIIPTGFLHDSDPVDTDSMESEIKRNSELLVRTLSDFGIDSRVINVNRGPVITLYEMQIAAGIKITKVVGLSDDIAMALAAYRVRIVAPIPGKSAIGVELPNKIREKVTLGDLVKSREYQAKKGSLKVGLGKDILGKPVTLDLKKQPHLLIAGSTGSGKSVCVNSIITSIVYNYDPNYVRFIMVDPKMVELQLYNGVPHLLTPVITEPQIAPSVLKWAIYEMERRYRLLASKNTRDIETYNKKIGDARKGEERLPFIVIIIDELADLMMVASKEVEGYITRLAQKARAIGIHLVLATQRPSVDVITGVIKANFPARIAFQVAQKTDSRTILDQNGAEKLLGKGDMLYQSPLTSYPVRIQGAFISEDETVSVVEHLRVLGRPDYIDIEESLKENETDSEIGEEEDELFIEALKIIEESRKASASYLQRRLSIGYNRAARIIERMEEMGYVGPQQGSKPREILI